MPPLKTISSHWHIKSLSKGVGKKSKKKKKKIEI